MAYFSCTVGAGFASGQEMLQYYAAFGWWGVPGAIIAMILMPLAAMIAMQYGSYFQATSHDTVFQNVSSTFMAKFVDYSITFTQFCIAFVMLAGAGANLNQQWGWPTWVGAALMAVLVIVVGMLDVNKITNILGALTPLIVVLFVVTALYVFMSPPSDLAAAGAFAEANVETTLPNWWVSTFNYVGIAMMGGISMGIVMGGDTLDIKTAGRGGTIGGLLFGVLLLVMVVAMIFRAPDVYQDPLPTLSLINEVHPWLGIVASVVIYLMIFSTSLGNFYSLSRRLASKKPRLFHPILIGLVVIGFVLSFVDFATLVGFVFPIMGYVALVMITVLVVTWFRRGSDIVGQEARRRDKIRALIHRRLHPERKFTKTHRVQLRETISDSNLENRHLRDTLTQDVAEALDADPATDFSKDELNVKEVWNNTGNK